MAKNKPTKSEAANEPSKTPAASKSKASGKATPAAASTEQTKPAGKTTATPAAKSAASPGKAAPSKAAAKPTTPSGKPLTASELYAVLAERTTLEKKKVAQFFEALAGVVAEQIGKGGPGELKIPGLFKVKRKDLPARPEMQRESPFEKGKMITVKARPASTSVKVQALKKLTDSVNPA